MRTIAIINLKGGVAKTTSSINIAYILMRKGYKVLLVDNDKQGDCSRGMNRRTQDGEGIDRIMVDRHPDMEKLINKTDYLHLDIITANLGLLTANMEVTMDRVRPQQNRLRKALQQVADNYDFCVIDNAPDINVSVINALTAADDVLIPVEVDDNTLEGMNELLDQIDDVKEELNPDLENVRCFVTKYQKFNQAHLQGAEIIEEQYPIMRTKIRLLINGNRYVSCDYGTQNATVFLLWNKGTNGKWYCIREYYYSGRDKGKQKTDSEYADDLKEWLDGTKIKAIIVDPSAASFIAELRKRGYKVLKANNDVLDGIRLVGMLLNLEKIVFASSCKETIKEFASYIWDEKALERGEDKPVKQFDHCCDAVRYLCSTIIGRKAARFREIRR